MSAEIDLLSENMMFLHFHTLATFLFNAKRLV